MRLFYWYRVCMARTGWTAREGVMAKVIEFYVPANFQRQAKWVPIERRGQIIEFTLPKKSA